MRIISGSAKGLPLQVPKGEVRPTTDRVREAMFSILHPIIEGAVILDLFAGSGALSLEALSRGARSSKMIDLNKSSCDTIKKNLDKTKLKGAQIVQSDALKFLQREASSGARYDIIFADPPYCKGPLDKDFLKEILEGPTHKLLKDGAILVGEAEAGWGLAREDAIIPSPWTLITRRDYGKNTLLFLEKEFTPETSEH